MLSFDGEALAIEMTGMSLVIPATGEWDGEILVPAGLIVRLGPAPTPRRSIGGFRGKEAPMDSGLLSLV